MWVLQQYYVGAEQQHVAIYQGVRGSVLGMPLQHLREQTDSSTDGPARRPRRNTVQDGILVTEGGLAGAQAKVGLLRGNMLRALPRAGSGAAVGGTAPADAAGPAHRSRRAPHRSRARPPPPPIRTGRRPERRHHPAPDGRPEPGLTCRPVS